MKNLRPMINTFIEPKEIMLKYFNENDIATMTRYLSDYQRTGQDWREYRKKIPDYFLDNWANVLNECWRNGFCNPHVFRNKIVWSRIMSFEHQKDMIDRCTLCMKSAQSGNCTGDFRRKENGSRFEPCWKIA